MSKTNKPMFIHTTDEEEACKLIELGYELLSNSGDIWTFLTNDKLNFTNVIDSKKIVCNNRLMM